MHLRILRSSVVIFCMDRCCKPWPPSPPEAVARFNSQTPLRRKSRLEGSGLIDLAENASIVETSRAFSRPTFISVSNMVIDAGIIGTALLLALMSIMSWTLIIRQWLVLRWMRQGIDDLSKGMRNSDNLEGIIASLEARSDSASHRIVAAAQGKDAARGSYVHLDRQTRSDIALRGVLRALDQLMTRGLGVLASVASTAPFVGLFGTVWGIFGALTEIAQASEASIQAVAQPMGEALLMTAAGIGVALPAVVAYNRFSRWRKDLALELWTLAEDLRQIVQSLHAREAQHPAGS
ncbi:MAG: MotA/TolQ/ExbB proton channel family protein [Betaproteobacteria bacterium]|nr:MotA/TolQ/ExbB proton channel family protein [Betaproteobacteria bacterium]NDA72982.1 MotA/TolQ/ExbB proton channel family protein [Betaproteobacteria bacterium]NDH31119.1 MotA/TolQ/ExbB proton channel family protein [Betaproteobacteria bacterium]